MAKSLTKNNGLVFAVAEDFNRDENHHEWLGMIQSIFLHKEFVQKFKQHGPLCNYTY